MDGSSDQKGLKPIVDNNFFCDHHHKSQKILMNSMTQVFTASMLKEDNGIIY